MRCGLCAFKMRVGYLWLLVPPEAGVRSPCGGRVKKTRLCVAACADVLSNCNQYGSFACVGQYAAWAQDNCRKTCGYCGEHLSPSLLPTTHREKQSKEWRKEDKDEKNMLG